MNAGAWDFEGGSGWWALAAASVLALGVPAVAAAEPYGALFVGAAFTENTDLKEKLDLGTLSAADGTIKDLRVDTAAVYGGKLGYFFEPRVLDGNVGLELEAYHFKANVEEQTAQFAGTILSAPFKGAVHVVSSDIEVTAVALNALYRYPLGTSEDFPRGRYQPYVGAGLGAFIARLSTTTTPLDVNKDIHDTDTRLGGQFLGGVRVLVTHNIGVFAEYKYVMTQTFDFEFKVPGTVFGGVPVTETARDRTELSGHHFTAGVSFHW
jgi:opacity protein-like surface antigen